jgi:hypothetical protein
MKMRMMEIGSKKYIQPKTLIAIPKGRNHFGDLGLDRRIILKCILENRM